MKVKLGLFKIGTDILVMTWTIQWQNDHCHHWLIKVQCKSSNVMMDSQWERGDITPWSLCLVLTVVFFMHIHPHSQKKKEWKREKEMTGQKLVFGKNYLEASTEGRERRQVEQWKDYRNIEDELLTSREQHPHQCKWEGKVCPIIAFRSQRLLQNGGSRWFVER